MLTVISFWVSVPVLSVQITVVQPSVSTADRRLISALRLAMRCTPMARDKVTVGRRPSGIKATIMPRAKINAATGSDFARKIARIKNSTPIETAMAETFFVRLPISFCRGLDSSLRLCVKPAIRPNSVSIPVEQTIALPVPEETVVPAKIRFGDSTVEISVRSTWSRPLCTGFDSPVRVD